MKKKYISKNKLKKYANGVELIQPDYSSATGMAAKNSSIDSTVSGLAAMSPQGGRYAGLGASLGTTAQGLIGTRSDGSPKVGGSAVGSGLKYAGIGAALGSNLGPAGAAIGAGVGAAGGAVLGATQAREIQEQMKLAKKTADFQNYQNQNFSAKDTEQIGYAKKGLDMTKKSMYKCKQKYPGGTDSLKTPSAKFSQGELDQLNGLKSNPQLYKQAFQGAIGYTPKYTNPTYGSREWDYENNSMNSSLNTFNQRDMSKAPVNFDSYYQNMNQTNISNNMNFQDKNTKLTKFVNDNSGGGKYPNGTSAISLQPQEKEALRKLPPNSPEYRQAVWNMMGYEAKPYPSGSQGYKDQEKMFASATNWVNQGFRPYSEVKNGKEVKGYQSVYKSGTKQVEIEGDEIVMSKNGNKFQMKGDFKGGPSHAEGGIDIEATEGDVIFPKNKRGQVIEAIEDGNHSKLESIRKTLPKDKPKAAAGTYMSGKGISNPFSSDVTKQLAIPKSATANNFNPVAGNTGSGMNIGNFASTAGELAPIAYNLAKGLFDKTTKTNRRSYTPQNYNYQDQSQGLRNETNSLYNQDKQLIRNASGGNAGTYLANAGMASANKFKRLQGINNGENTRRNDINNANVDLNNNAQQTNINLNNQYDQMDLQNQAKKQEFVSTGLGQISQYSQQKQKDKNASNMQNKVLGSIQSGNYKINPETFAIEKRKDGVQSVKTKYKYKRK